MDDRRTLICKYVISSTIALLLPFLSPTHLFAASFTTEGTDKRPQHISQLNDTETVDLHRGNLIVRQQDINLPGNGGLNIEIWRTYDMHATSAGLTSTHNKSYKWTTLGLGWTLSAAPKISFEYSFVTDYQDEDPGYLGKTFTHTPYYCAKEDPPKTSMDGAEEYQYLIYQMVKNNYCMRTALTKHFQKAGGNLTAQMEKQN